MAAASASFAATGLFPPLVVRMLRVGENTGALEDALNNVTYFFTRDVRESVTKLRTDPAARDRTAGRDRAVDHVVDPGSHL